MKRWAIGSIAFFATLTVGILFVLPLVERTTENVAEPLTMVPLESDGPVEKNEPSPILEIIDEIDGRDDQASRFPIKLLTTGEGFHGDEVAASNGDKWLGLFENEGKFYLHDAPLKVKRVYDEIVDFPNTRQKTGKSVSVNGSARSIFLLKNAAFPKGEVPTLFMGKTWDDIRSSEDGDLAPIDILTTLKENFSATFELKNTKYELKVVRALNPEREEILALVLESGNVRQVLHTMGSDFNSDVGTLYWVGDIDRDGKPDFYMDLFVHYNVGNKVLFISSQAEKGKLLKKVAYFWTTGC